MDTSTPSHEPFYSPDRRPISPTLLTTMEYLSEKEQNALQDLLVRKLKGVPCEHISSLTLRDIATLSPNAMSLPSIPPDIQLDFFLRHRATMLLHSDTPLKSKNQQSLTLTRALFFYRLSPTHQFHRYHDSVRWNIFVFLALLAIAPDKFTRASRDTTTTTWTENSMDGDGDIEGEGSGGKAFATTYLASVLEHHNSPQNFTLREHFIEIWKFGPWEFFRFGAAQQKVLRRQCGRVGREMSRELVSMREEMGEERYQKLVGKFVGVLVAGRRDRDQAPEEGGRGEDIDHVGGNWDGDGDVGLEEEREGGSRREMEMVHIADNYLLKALRVPLKEQYVVEIEVPGTETRVARMEDAVQAAKRVRARDMLLTMMELFN
ncbi:hypothetical protein BCR34DRAFT_587725 [Clohesyomyces aquaticus]|uniref:Uncharacterized protein n=1 Tax=Clohesyomyces aquaticus TaxID=1231657 RepID=A0A1Y1ZNB6_9PLEO|nr:hypothetical protein BCR34DRAFT_587725 [Clohesyomyces aquaticus]